MFSRLFGRQPTIPALVDALGDQDSARAEAAANALLSRGGEATPALTRVLGDATETWLRRKNAAALLGQLGGDEAIDPLIAALGDTNRNVQQGAAWALGKLKARRAAPALLERLVDPATSLFTKARCLGALEAIGADHAEAGILVAARQIATWERALDAGDLPSELAAEAERARILYGDDVDEAALDNHLRQEVAGFTSLVAATCRRLGKNSVERLRTSALGDSRLTAVVTRIVQQAGY